MKGLLRRLVARSASPPVPASQRYRPRPSHPVSVSVHGEASIDVLRARDVSLTGIGVYVSHHFDGFDPSEPLQLIIQLPGQAAFTTWGCIVHETRTGSDLPFVGLRFTRCSDDARGRLLRYLESGLAEPIGRAGAA